MRIVLVIAGVALVATAGLWLILGGDEKQGMQAPLSAPAMMRDSGVPINSEIEWKQYEVTVEDQLQTVYVREFPEPISVKRLTDEFESNPDARLTAVELLVAHYRLASEVLPNETGMRAYANLFDDPEKMMTSYTQLAEELGSWEKCVDHMRQSVENDRQDKRLLGDAVVGAYHVFIVQRHPQDTHVAYLTARRNDDGRFVTAMQTPEFLSELLRNSKILELFPNISNPLSSQQ